MAYAPFAGSGVIMQMSRGGTPVFSFGPATASGTLPGFVGGSMPGFSSS
jgi:hypothetical protein